MAMVWPSRWPTTGIPVTAETPRQDALDDTLREGAMLVLDPSTDLREQCVDHWAQAQVVALATSEELVQKS
jgi:hypothetical protein